MKRNDWILLLAIVILPGWKLFQIGDLFDPKLVFGGVGAISFIAFTAFGWDKRKAQGGRRRISERTLHLLELFGGWPGSYLGQRVFRHKTLKRSYQVYFWLIVFLYQTISAYLLFGK